MQESAGFSPPLSNLSVTTYGLLVTISGTFIAKPSIARFGLRGHTTVCAAETALGFLIWSLPRGLPHFLGIAVQGCGYGRHDTVHAAGLRWAEGAGMGKGEAAAHFQNLRGFTAIVMPMVYARLYGLGLRWGVPGLCFVLAAAMSGVGGLLNHALLTDADYMS